MNVLNRIIMIFVILVLLVAVIVLVVKPFIIIDFVGAQLGLLEGKLQDAQFWQYLLIGAAVAAVILLVLLILELRRPRKKGVRIKTKGSANAVLGVDSVVQSLEYRIDELAGVRKVQPHIVSHGRDVEVTIDLDTSPSVNIPVLTDQIVDLSHDIVEGQLGVKIRRKVNVNVHHEPYPRGTMPPTQPMPKGGDAIAAPPKMVEEEKLYAPVDAKPAVAPKPVPVTAPEPTIVEGPAPEPEPALAPVDSVVIEERADDLLANLDDYVGEDDLEGQDE